MWEFLGFPGKCVTTAATKRFFFLFSFFFLLSFALFAWVVFCFSFKICFALEGCKRGMLGGGEIGRIRMCDVKTTKNQYIWLWGSPHQEPGNIGG